MSGMGSRAAPWVMDPAVRALADKYFSAARMEADAAVRTLPEEQRDYMERIWRACMIVCAASALRRDGFFAQLIVPTFDISLPDLLRSLPEVVHAAHPYLLEACLLDVTVQELERGVRLKELQAAYVYSKLLLGKAKAKASRFLARETFAAAPAGSAPSECTPFGFLWLLFVAARAALLPPAPDLIPSYTLLLACLACVLCHLPERLLRPGGWADAQRFPHRNSRGEAEPLRSVVAAAQKGSDLYPQAKLAAASLDGLLLGLLRPAGLQPQRADAAPPASSGFAPSCVLFEGLFDHSGQASGAAVRALQQLYQERLAAGLVLDERDVALLEQEPKLMTPRQQQQEQGAPQEQQQQQQQQGGASEQQGQAQGEGQQQSEGAVEGTAVGSEELAWQQAQLHSGVSGPPTMQRPERGRPARAPSQVPSPILLELAGLGGGSPAALLPALPPALPNGLVSPVAGAAAAGGGGDEEMAVASGREEEGVGRGSAGLGLGSPPEGRGFRTPSPPPRRQLGAVVSEPPATPFTSALESCQWVRSVASTPLDELCAALLPPLRACGFSGDDESAWDLQVRSLVEAALPDGSQDVGPVAGAAMDADRDEEQPAELWGQQAIRERRREALAIYYQSLSSMLLAEEARSSRAPGPTDKPPTGPAASAAGLQLPAAACGSGGSGGGGSKLGRMALRRLLSSRTFHAALVACSAECLVACYQMAAALPFPAVLGRLELQPFDFQKLLDRFVRHMPALPREVKRHLLSIQEKILESVAWQPGSSLYAALAAACGAASPATSGSAGAAAMGAASPPSDAEPAPMELAAGHAVVSSPRGSMGSTDSMPWGPGTGQQHQQQGEQQVPQGPAERRAAGFEHEEGPAHTEASPAKRPRIAAAPAGPTSAPAAASQQQQQQQGEPQEQGGERPHAALQPNGGAAPSATHACVPGGAAAARQAPEASAPQQAQQALSLGAAVPAGGDRVAHALLSEFVGRMLGLAAVRLTDLLEKLDLGAAADTQQLLLQAHTLLREALLGATWLMRGRHLDQLLLCSVYGVCKVHQLEQATFKNILAAYKQQPSARPETYKNVSLLGAGGLVPGALPLPALSADIIAFYNRVFLPAVKPVLLAVVNGTIPPAPLPSNLSQLRSPQRPLHQLPPFMQTPLAWRRPVSAESPALPALFPLSPALLRPPPLGQLDQLPANLLQLLGLGLSGAPAVPPPPPVSLYRDEPGYATDEQGMEDSP